MQESFPQNETIGHRLRKFYEGKGLERPKFADLLGINYGKISDYVSDRSTPGEAFFKALVANFRDADIGYLLTGLPTLGEVEQRTIPIVAQIHAGPLTATMEDVIGQVVTQSREKDLIALQVKGESMLPMIEPGDLVICSTRGQFVNGKIYAVRTLEEETTLKHVKKRHGGYELIPENEAFRSSFVRTEEMDKLFRVIELRRTY